MTKEHILAVDAGTGSCRAVLFDLDGKQVAMAQKEWSHKSIPGYEGSQVFDTKKNWDSISECIRSAINKANVHPESIKAVSSTSMREGMVLYDETGEEIWACPNVDARADAEARELISRGLADDIYLESGDWVSITSPSRFMWIKNHQPEVHRRTAKMNMLSDWILYKLSGEFATDHSIASSSGLLNLSERTWSTNIIGMLDINESILPNVYESGTVIGTVHSRAAEETGLMAGTPVVLGGADTQMGLAGIGRIHPNQSTLLGGSFWQHTVVVDEPIVDPEKRLRTLCHSVPGKWMLEGIGFYCGLTMRWFRDAFCDLEKQQAIEQNTDPYILMERLAMNVPAGSNGVMGIFSNVMNAKNWAHASPSLIQFDISNPEQSGKKECIRAIQESAAYISNGHLKIIEQLTDHQYDEIVFTGGGAKGELWPQIIADVLGCVVKVPVVKESSALGAAIYGGIGIGAYENVQSAVNDQTNIEKSYHPNKDNHEKYTELYDRWLKTYGHALELVEKNLARPLWKAIGT